MPFAQKQIYTEFKKVLIAPDVSAHSGVRRLIKSTDIIKAGHVSFTYNKIPYPEASVIN